MITAVLLLSSGTGTGSLTRYFFSDSSLPEGKAIKTAEAIALSMRTVTAKASPLIRADNAQIIVKAPAMPS
jgi:hypothetical protein